MLDWAPPISERCVFIKWTLCFYVFSAWSSCVVIWVYPYFEIKKNTWSASDFFLLTRENGENERPQLEPEENVNANQFVKKNKNLAALNWKRASWLAPTDGHEPSYWLLVDGTPGVEPGPRKFVQSSAGGTQLQTVISDSQPIHTCFIKRRHYGVHMTVVLERLKACRRFWGLGLT